MYVHKAFRQNDMAEIRRFTEHYPLAVLAVQHGGRLQAAHIPLYWHDNGTEWGALRGHFAKANPIWQVANGDNCWLAVFQDSGCYISPNWYPSKHWTHKAVPTWNYRAVHINGRLRLIEEPQEVRGILAALSAVHEQTQPEPWTLEDAPADYIEAMSKAVVCFEMSVETVEACYKLSQNKTEEDFAGVIGGLRQVGGEAERQMADNMASLKAGLMRGQSRPVWRNTRLLGANGLCGICRIFGLKQAVLLGMFKCLRAVARAAWDKPHQGGFGLLCEKRKGGIRFCVEAV